HSSLLTPLAPAPADPTIAGKRSPTPRSEAHVMATQLGATRLLGLNLTPGKLRGLQRICNANGTLSMVATDQNSSMIGMIKDSLKHGAPLGAVEPGWGVDKIKRCGADAVKLLAPFEPGELDSAEHQFAFLQQIHAECQKHDILLLLEPVTFPYDGEKKDDPKY